MSKEMACEIKEKALELVKCQIMGNIDSVNAEELGEIADIAKDMAQLIKYCEEAEYYEKVVESMEEYPEAYAKKYATDYKNRMYYSTINNKKTLEDHISEITEMVNDLDANEKSNAKQKLIQMVNKF